MSYKLGLILSMVFVVLFSAFGIDLITIQFVYSDLDAKSIAISYQIAQYGTIDDSLVNKIENNYHISFKCVNNCQPMFGDIVDYTISKQVNTIVISPGPTNVTIQRSAIIGYYK